MDGWTEKYLYRSHVVRMCYKSRLSKYMIESARFIMTLHFPRHPLYRVFQKKNVQSFAQHKFRAIHHRITLFASKCSKNIVVYQSAPNLYEFTKSLC